MCINATIIHVSLSMYMTGLQSLLSHHADAAATDEMLMTPVHLTVARPSTGAGGVKECLAVLLKANAPLQAKDKEGLTPLLRAAVAGNKIGLEVLLAKVPAKDKLEAGQSAGSEGGHVLVCFLFINQYWDQLCRVFTLLFCSVLASRTQLLPQHEQAKWLTLRLLLPVAEVTSI